MRYPSVYREFTRFWFSGILALCLVTIFSQQVASQNNRPSPLQRSFSDPRLNRNSSHFYRQRSISYRDHCKTNYKFDYVQLTLMWAPGACSTSPKECIREENRFFTVHGMWPTIKGTQEPSNCCFDNTFDFKALQPILQDLNQYWFSYYDANSNRGFWSHEWLKHGTCSRDIESLRGEARYFGTTVQLAKKLPVLETLSKANIVPSNSKSYPALNVYNALKPLSQGKTLQITCDYEHNQPIPILTGIGLCYDENLLPADCPETKPKCKKDIILPASSQRTFRL